MTKWETHVIERNIIGVPITCCQSLLVRMLFWYMRTPNLPIAFTSLFTVSIGVSLHLVAWEQKPCKHNRSFERNEHFFFVFTASEIPACYVERTPFQNRIKLFTVSDTDWKLHSPFSLFFTGRNIILIRAITFRPQTFIFSIKKRIFGRPVWRTPKVTCGKLKILMLFLV